MLWVDFCQISYGLRYDIPTTLFGYRFTRTSIAVTNGIEVALNSFAPRRIRPWLNVVTIVGHLPFLVQWSKRPIGVLQGRRGEEVLHVGWRVWP